MSQKILLTAGCSYTDPLFFSQDDSLSDDQRGGWPMWPEIMADSLDLKCVNLGQSGAGNDHIFKEIIKALSVYKDKIDTVAILWTGAERQNFFTWRLNAPVELSLRLGDPDNRIRAFDWMESIGIGPINSNYWTSKGFDRDTYKWILDDYIHKLFALTKVLEAYDIKLIMMQGVTVLDFWTYKRLYDNKKIDHFFHEGQAIIHFTKNSASYELEKNKKNFIGWPIFTKINGFHFDSIRDKATTVSDIDGHPNKLGQQQIANLFIDRHKEIYND